MNKGLLITGFAIYSLISSGQLNSEFKDALSVVLTNNDVAKLVFVDFPAQQKSTYILTNEVIVENAENYYETFFEIYGSDSLGSKVFSTTKGDVRVFDKPLQLSIVSRDQLKTVVVIDSFRKTKSGLRVGMYTTNLESKRWHSATGSKEKFKRISCILNGDGGVLNVVSIKVSGIGHKSIIN